MRFKNVLLKDIAKIIMGQSPKSEYYSDVEGTPFLQGTRTFGRMYPKIDTYTKKVTKMVSKNDILFSVRAPVGDINFAPTDLCIGRGLACIKALSVNKHFLYYLLVGNLRMYQSKSTGTIFNSINKRELEYLEFHIPTLDYQKKIGQFLWSLDSKIELNNSIISDLEELAQTLFKRWFVDFEFPNEEGKPYKSSGGKMVESELGMIPEGWGIEALGNVTEIQNGFAFKSKDYASEGIKVIRTLNIDDDGLLIRNNDLKFLPEEFYQNERYRKQRLEKFDSLLVMVGATIGKLGIVLTPNLPSLQNQNMWRFRTKRLDVTDQFIYLLLQNSIESMMGFKSGSAREFFRKESFLKEKFVIPDAKSLENLNVFSDLFEKINVLHSENINLNGIRDTLLPKLLSGEIELPDEMEVTDDVPIS